MRLGVQIKETSLDPEEVIMAEASTYYKIKSKCFMEVATRFIDEYMLNEISEKLREALGQTLGFPVSVMSGMCSCIL